MGPPEWMDRSVSEPRTEPAAEPATEPWTEPLTDEILWIVPMEVEEPSKTLLSLVLIWWIASDLAFVGEPPPPRKNRRRNHRT